MADLLVVVCGVRNGKAQRQGGRARLLCKPERLLVQPCDARRLCSIARNGEVADDPKLSGGRLRGVRLAANAELIEHLALV